MKIAALFATAVAFCVAACASTGAIPIGKDTYMISKRSATGFQSAVGIKADILREANRFCVEQGLVMQMISLQTKDGVPGESYATAELVFRALSEEDPDNVRLDVETVPDTGSPYR